MLVFALACLRGIRYIKERREGGNIQMDILTIVSEFLIRLAKELETKNHPARCSSNSMPLHDSKTQK